MNQPKCFSTDGWMIKMWHVFKNEYLAVQKNEIMKFSVKWITVEKLILNVVSQAFKGTCCMSSPI